MNTNKQINIMILLVFGAIALTGAYWLIDPDRATWARERQLDSTVERGAWLYSQNCRTCHGNVGEGGAASNRLRAAPPLNRPDLQGIRDGEVDPAALSQAYDLVYDTIVCGRVGRAMPTWGQSQGGTLNEEQIKQLTTFITEGSGWEVAEEYALEGVPEFALHSPDTQDELHLVEAIDEDDTELTLTSRVDVDTTDAVSPGLRLQIDDELMLIEEVSETGVVTVERGIGTTDPATHEADAQVLEPPVPPDPAPVTEQACGQIAGAQVEAPAEAPSAELSIVAAGIQWNKDRLFALPDVPLTITVDNQDEGTPHNIVFFEGAEPGGEEIAGTEIENGPVMQTLNFGPLAAGDYYYYCEVHPNMEGVLTASAEDQSSGGGASEGEGDGAGLEDPVTTETLTP